MENWLNKNISDPYAKANDINLLSTLTQLDGSIIRRWLENERRTKHLKRKITNKNYFTIEEKLVLHNFYETKSKHPGPQDLLNLQSAINKDEKKIRAWFCRERYINNSNRVKINI